MRSIPFKQPLLSISTRFLKRSAYLWFAVAFISQLILAYYVAFLYGSSAAVGDWEKWNTVMPHGYIAGDSMGNTAVAVHIFMAFMVLVGGPLQLIPQVRKSAPTFHRWNGRMYIFNGFLISISGIYMVWVRGAVGGIPGHIGISINAMLIMLFAFFALRTAMARKFDKHFRWVIRLYLVMSGVWFFRLGLILWIFLNGGAVGFDPETVTGPFITFIVFAMYLIPLTILELYWYMEKQAGMAGKIAMASLMLIFTVMTSLGTFLATVGMWLPRLS